MSPLRPAVLELVGPAGAGKSTLARSLRARDASVRADLSLWGLPRAELLVGALRLIPTILAALASGRPFRWPEIAQMIRLDALRREVTRSLEDRRIVILDEGPVFALSWLDVFYGRNGRDRAFAIWRQRALAAWADLLDSVVLLDASDPSLAHRIRTRAKPHPVKDKPDAEIYGFAAGFRRAFERVIADLLAVGGENLRLTILDTGDTPADRHAEQLFTTLHQAGNGH